MVLFVQYNNNNSNSNNNNAHFMSTGFSQNNQRRASADMILCMPRPIREKRKSMDTVLPNKYQTTESGGRRVTIPLTTFGEEPLESEQQSPQQQQQPPDYTQNSYYAV
uniref:Uncharacterized protein n=1 Tax=Attheya septentrionalis TaxID=420275 RepID=A0A7S2XI60_9STRA